MLIAAAVLILILVPLWLAWNAVARRRLEQRVILARSHGEPVYREDFVLPTLPDDHNGAVLLRAAGDAIPNDPCCPNESNLTFPTYPPFPPPWRSMINRAMAVNQKPLALARRARTLNDAVWQPIEHSPVTANFVMPNYLSPQRSLANLLADTAMVDHVDGNDAEALERIRDIFHQSDLLSQHCRRWLDQLVSLGISALAQARLQVICSDGLHLGESDSAGLKPVRRQVMLDLIQYLLNQHNPALSERQSILGERMEVLDLAEYQARRTWVLGPALRLDQILALDDGDIELRAVEAANWPAADALIATLVVRPGPSTLRAKTAIPSPAKTMRFSQLLAPWQPNPHQYLLTYYRIMADRQALAAILALRLYYADHHSWPRQLSDLMPQYLPVVPHDLFASAGAPLGYAVVIDPTVSVEPRPVVFFNRASVGNAAPPATPCIGWQNGSVVQWRDVTRWTAPP